MIPAGRRWGKTSIAVPTIIGKTIDGLHKCKDPLSWWVAPTYDRSRKAFFKLYTILNRANIIEGLKSSPPMTIYLKGGGSISFRSAGTPRLLVGDPLVFVVIDEAGMVNEITWYESIRPSLSDYHGEALLIGTPKGKNWFYDEYLKGQDGTHPEYNSVCQPSHRNNYVFPGGVKDPEYLSLKENMPAWQFQQEILAQFMDDMSTVFTGVDEIIGGEFDVRRTEHSYYAGVDLGRKVDNSSITIQAEDGRVVFHRTIPTGVNWKSQVNIIVQDLRKYNARALVDATGIGDPIYEVIFRKYKRARPFVLTNLSKEDIIMALAMDIGSQDIMVPEKALDLLTQLRAFQRDCTGRTTKYSAPSGMHDDGVISLALANFGRRSKGNSGEFRIIEYN